MCENVFLYNVQLHNVCVLKIFIFERSFEGNKNSWGRKPSQPSQCGTFFSTSYPPRLYIIFCYHKYIIFLCRLASFPRNKIDF